MTTEPLTVVRACLKAYADKDRAAIEALVHDDYRFTSPLDNGLDRAAYFERCWPNSAHLESFDVVHDTANGETVFVVYEAKATSGKRFRNCEVHTVRGGKLVATEVYFGWDVPHKAPAGGFIDS